jgi:hypothetical protein
MKTFAILFAGGINDFCNYARYPADLGAVLTSLGGFPGLSAASITVLSGAGGGAFKFDNVPITGGLASRNGLQGALATVAANAKAEDRFFFFSSNHGGQKVPGQNSSTLYCWNGETVTPEELAGWSQGIQGNFQAFVLGQCYSGGFVNALQTKKRAILTACSWSEVSWASTTMSARYDEFIYRIAEGFEGRAATLDALFAYAKKADVEKETPQYNDAGGIGGIALW